MEWKLVSRYSDSRRGLFFFSRSGDRGTKKTGSRNDEKNSSRALLLLVVVLIVAVVLPYLFLLEKKELSLFVFLARTVIDAPMIIFSHTYEKQRMVTIASLWLLGQIDLPATPRRRRLNL